MTVLTFPSSPTVGQVYNADNGVRYVYDGVKWVVETTTSTSEAVTNSTQDRVAPMFVDGDHNGISFTYNAATNALTATVTSSGLNTGTINLHNGGDQTAQILQFDNAAYQSVITGPTPAAGNNAQRLIIQGQRATGQGEGGDVYLWGGDAQTDGGDIKIYAGDADSNTEGYGGYVNIQGGDGYTQGGSVDIQGGYSTNGTGGDVRIGAATSGNNLHGKVQISTNAGSWQFKPDGSLEAPTKTTTSYNGGINTAPTLTLGTLGSDTVITQPETDSVNTGDYAIRIQGQRGFGTWGNNTGNGGWGGHIQIWAGQGGESGGDLSNVRGGEGGYVDIQGGDGQAGRDGGDIYLKAGNTNYSIGYTGTVYGGNVDISAGNATNSIETNFGEGGNVIITAGLGNKINGNIQFNAGQGSWRFNADGSFSINGNEVSVATNNWGISIGGGVGATGIVYTAKQLDLASIRAHVTIEGNEDSDATGLHTQACDIMIVRRVAIGGAVTVDAVVYGVIYTGAAPLATIDAQWNPTGGPNASGRIEITATPTSATNNVYVKVYATEVARGD